MELAAYLRIFRRWLWLIILLALLGGGISFVVARTQAPMYQASTTIQIGSSRSLSNPATSLLSTEVQLAQTYAVLARTFPVIEGTVKALNLPFPPEKLREYFTTAVIPQTALLTLTVTYPDPLLVALIANELGRQLILNSPTNLTADQQAQIEVLKAEITSAREQLERGRAELKQIEGRLTEDLTPEERTRLNALRSELLTQINAAQSNLSGLSNTLAILQQEGSANILSVVETARNPSAPINGGGWSSVIFAALVGAVFGGGIAYLIEYLNDTVRTPSEVPPLLGVPLLSGILPFGRKGSYVGRLVAWMQPRSPAAEGYRALRVNLIYSERSAARKPPVYLITSAKPEEGKSITAANLAVSFANAGMRVLLIDADLRHPSQHLIFNLPNNVGLTNVLSRRFLMRVAENAANRDAVPDDEDEGDTDAPFIPDPEYMRLLIQNLVNTTEINDLEIITAGKLRATSTELMASVQAQAILRAIAHFERYNVVILDAPPVLSVSDAGVLANAVGARVVLVVEAGRTHRGAAVRAVQSLLAIGVKICGVVLNRLNPREADEGYSYAYYGTGETRPSGEGDA
ncbi:MAG: AAA family ATPase [Anaerolinea sp.]|nr:AAA family ATPase [Anaerolinea sp.]MCC6974125.1 AAA family ATPase [Anaerolineae bacterium]